MKSIIEFEHGERTCSSAPGEFCHWHWTRRGGEKHVCVLFQDDNDEPIELFKDGHGYVERGQACKTAYPVSVEVGHFAVMTGDAP